MSVEAGQTQQEPLFSDDPSGQASDIPAWQKRVTQIAKNDAEINGTISAAHIEATSNSLVDHAVSAAIVDLNDAAVEAEKARNRAKHQDRLAIDAAKAKARADAARRTVAKAGVMSPAERYVQEMVELGKAERAAESERLQREADELAAGQQQADESADEAEVMKAEAATDQGTEKWQWPIAVDDEKAAQQVADRLARWRLEKKDDEA